MPAQKIILIWSSGPIYNVDNYKIKSLIDPLGILLACMIVLNQFLFENLPNDNKKLAWLGEKADKYVFHFYWIDKRFSKYYPTLPIHYFVKKKKKKKKKKKIKNDMTAF